MQVQTMIASALDKAGGLLVRQALDTMSLAGSAFDIIEGLVAELKISGKPTPYASYDVTFAADTDTGTINQSAISQPDYLRYRRDTSSAWKEIDVVSSIQDLTRAKELGREAILFTGTAGGILQNWTYYLSFLPDEPIDAELWGPAPIAQVAHLGAEITKLPEEVELLAAHRLADFALNQLLILDQNRYQAFVIAQKQTMAREVLRLEHWWRVYRTRKEDWKSLERMESYDAFGEFVEMTNENIGLEPRIVT